MSSIVASAALRSRSAFSRVTSATAARESFKCPKLTGGSGTTYDENFVDATYARVDGGTSNPGYFSSTFVPYFTVRFEDHDGTLLKEMQVAKGGNAVPPANPTRDGYKFTGWDTDYTNVQSDLTVTAKYKKKVTYYTVTFVDYDGTVLKTEEVAAGGDAEEPEVKEREGYYFIGWDKDYTNITSDLTVTAQYEKKTETALDNLSGAADAATRKLLRNGVLYILRGGKTYDVTGRAVR